MLLIRCFPRKWQIDNQAIKRVKGYNDRQSGLISKAACIMKQRKVFYRFGSALCCLRFDSQRALNSFN